MERRKERYGRVEKPKKRIPINLAKKARREARNRGELIERRKKKRPKRRKLDPANAELEALIRSTQDGLKQILSETPALSDINFDCTPEELLGEIAIAEGHATIVYVERDGLSTLTIVLPQKEPTIANLKRAIESAARVQLQREQRQRLEERLQRRSRAPTTPHPSRGVSENSSRSGYAAPAAKETTQSQQQQQRRPSEALLEASIRSSMAGELVCSATRFGHHHRPNVSWRFLWRCYVLFHIERNVPIDDSNGRRLLSECGIENATTLKFTKREIYFGRKRQK